ncbi:MAG: hypothetical protein ABJC87_18315 [Roseobacter sp.]
MKVSASGYDPRIPPSGCSPDGCIPENTRDHNLSSNSRWSCKGDILDNDKGCWIKYSFDEPQDLEEIEIAFYKGDEDTRTLKVYLNGKYHGKIKSSGNTDDFQTFDLNTDETSELKLYLNDYKSNSDVWFSLTEVCSIGDLPHVTLHPARSLCT